MKKEKILTPLTIILSTTFFSDAAWAAEDAAFKVSIWPFVLLAIVLFVFRKKIIAESTVPASESKAHATEKTMETRRETKPATTGETATSASDEVTDLTQHVEQCQGTTAKGARCSRTANLEPIVVKVENKQYRFLTCKQHNNEGFIPFHFR